MIPIAFPGPVRPITALLADPVADLLPLVLPGWAGRPCTNVATPHIRVDNRHAGFRVQAPTLPGGVLDVREAVTAAGTAGGALTAAYIAQMPAHMELHAAACELDGGVVVFVGGTGAGKSTLTLRLASLGHRLLGDDRIGLRMTEPDGLECIALGVAPKARLPLPEDMDPEYESFIGQWTKTTYPGIAFLSLPPELSANLGETEPVRALILLERSPDRAPALRPAGMAAVVKNLLEHGLAPSLDTRELIVLAEQAAHRLPAYRLAFKENRDAIGLLAEHFADAAGA